MRRLWLPLVAVILSAITSAPTAAAIVDGDFNVVFVAGPRQNGDFTAFCAAFG